ncbi:phage tail protein [Kiloniella laminariae]|uniref:Phage tail protein n=1 Tax=Kiloniella laminariae TaxID=454162 RepID=A0ABT4LKS2_9PROT|nr:phage tail protein [Kiloniella laminariae]MCZ4281709.1 phage tail protein [Kiloniella laminariae]
MKKLADLRDFLIAHPIGIDPANLLTFAEKGSVQHHFDPDDPSFATRYDANVILVDFTGDFNGLIFIILSWLEDHEPHMKPEAISYHIDIQDHKRADVSLLIPLSEDILVSPVADGHEITSLPEPNIHKIGMPDGLVLPIPDPDDPTDPPPPGGVLIDDDTVSQTSVYSSHKTESRLSETIGDPAVNLVVLFDNLISQGNG